MLKHQSDDFMILIDAGLFIMGGDESPDEGPRRDVFLDPFHIDRYPVTNKDFLAFINEGGYSRQELWTEAAWAFINSRGIVQPNYFDAPHWNGPDQPVTGVSWWEAMAYAAFVGKSLPTEAQWERAARGRDGRRFPWGQDRPTPWHATFAEGCEPSELERRSTSVTTCDAGMSACGALDMAGNVFEWCLDNMSLDYSWDLTRRNPVYMTEETDDHVVRGGSGLHSADYLRCSARDYYPPTLRDNIVGIRLVLNSKRIEGSRS